MMLRKQTHRSNETDETGIAEEIRPSGDEFPNARHDGAYWDTPPFDSVRQLRERIRRRFFQAFESGALKPSEMNEAIIKIRNGFFDWQYRRWYRRREAAAVVAEIIDDNKQLNRWAIQSITVNREYLPSVKHQGTFFRPTRDSIEILDELKRWFRSVNVAMEKESEGRNEY